MTETGEQTRRGTMHEHPARRQVVGEMHLRRWPGLSSPCLIIQWLRFVSEDEKDAQRAKLTELTPAGRLAPVSGPQHLSGTLSEGVSFVWEGHSEATSLTLFLHDAAATLFRDPHSDQALSALIAEIEAFDGEVIRATRLWIAPDDAAAEAVLPQAAFVSGELVSCHLGGSARLWSDFRIQPDGYGRLLLAANDVPAGDLSRILQRLQELGNYRNMALVGLPMAQSYWPRLNRAEAMLREIGTDEIRADVRDDDLLTRISELSLELMSLATDSGFRMGATAAYARLVQDRLTELKVQPIAGYLSLIDFTQRRFLPAVRTCAAFAQREQQLSLRAAQFTSLLRARISTRIENQNARLLASLERSALMQVRLQQLVEGLSIVAVTYYALSLVEKVMTGVESVYPSVHGHLMVAVLTVPMLLVITVVLRAMKKKLIP